MSKNAEKIWKKCLDFIKDNIKVQAYKTWFVPIKPVKLENNALTIQVPSKFFYEWLEEHYIKLLRIALIKELGENAKLIYDVRMENTDNKTPQTVKFPSSNQYPIKPQDVEVPQQSNREFKNPFAIPGVQRVKVESRLNIKYNFSRFIEGESNKLARSTGMAVAKSPGVTAFNPLFIYGGVGLGKTHLVNAIGIAVKDMHPDKTVLYISTEEFVEQFVEATRKNTRNNFIHYYQMIDVLIVDDIQFLSGKKGTQDVFFHIFNHLFQNQKQIILTSDKHPTDIQYIEDRLISRFKWGLTAELEKPDYTTRLDIIKDKLYTQGIVMPDEVVEYVARNINTHVRDIEGCLILMIAEASFNKKEYTIELAKKAVAKYTTRKRIEFTIEYILQEVSNFFNVPITDIHSNDRRREIVQARQVSMYYSKKLTNLSYQAIGMQIGQRGHATVMHSCKVIKNLKGVDKQFSSSIDKLNRIFNCS